MIILDFGSGNSCQNDVTIVKHMVDELKVVDTGKHEIVIKWQLFTDCPPNIPLQLDVFNYAYHYARSLGYKATSSVFDKESLDYLLNYDIPFVKLANRPDLYWLAGEVPRKVPVYVSCGENGLVYSIEDANETTLCCISEYPATVEQYEKTFFPGLLARGISDHTTDFQLYEQYKPSIYEVHYKLNDSTGPDAGEFARTSTMLKEIL